MVYYIMHRTQVLLDDWQYDTLKARGDQAGRSLSDMVREAVTQYLGGARASEPPQGLEAIAGIADAPGPSGRDHDRVLYPTGAQRSRSTRRSR